ncbi:MAG: zinc-ribbon domain-containing protein [Acidobacteriota bacterium]
MLICSNCGTEMPDDSLFCPQCGVSMVSVIEEATRRFSDAREEADTLQLPRKQIDLGTKPVERVNENTAPVSEPQRATMPVSQTAPPQIDQPHYAQPQYYQAPYPPAPYQPPPPAPYQPPARSGQPTISVGDWLSEGWRIYAENGVLMSFASFLGGLLSVLTLGILSGPLMMGLYRMAFKTMQGERPEIGDLFDWKGRFLQSFLASLISIAIWGGALQAGDSAPFYVISNLILTPLLTVLMGFVFPLLLDRKIDIAAAVNEVGRLIFSKDALMWWVVGLIFSTIMALSPFACGIGIFIAVPWMVCSAASAYRYVFGFDDPNRTLS